MIDYRKRIEDLRDTALECRKAGWELKPKRDAIKRDTSLTPLERRQKIAETTAEYNKTINDTMKILKHKRMILKNLIGADVDKLNKAERTCGAREKLYYGAVGVYAASCMDFACHKDNRAEWFDNTNTKEWLSLLPDCLQDLYETNTVK